MTFFRTERITRRAKIDRYDAALHGSLPFGRLPQKNQIMAEQAEIGLKGTKSTPIGERQRDDPSQAKIKCE
jgi:hypothetical protein